MRQMIGYSQSHKDDRKNMDHQETNYNQETKNNHKDENSQHMHKYSIASNGWNSHSRRSQDRNSDHHSHHSTRGNRIPGGRGHAESQ